AMPLLPMTGLYYVMAFGLPAFRDTTGELGFVQINTRALTLTFVGVVTFYAAYLFFDRSYGREIKPAVLPGVAAGVKLHLALWMLLVLYFAFVYIESLSQVPSFGQFSNGGGF